MELRKEKKTYIAAFGGLQAMIEHTTTNQQYAAAKNGTIEGTWFDPGWNTF
jgi:hypothetical protein